jgi:hypothetical protein
MGGVWPLDPAPTVDARLAFAAYKAALEIEEQACAFYASVIRRVGDLVTTDPHHVADLASPACGTPQA